MNEWYWTPRQSSFTEGEVLTCCPPLVVSACTLLTELRACWDPRKMKSVLDQILTDVRVDQVDCPSPA